MYIIVLIVGIVQGIVWGIATDKIIENKGYKENWFWWGFFFSFLALIVALTKPDVNNSKPLEVQPDVKSQPSKIIKTERLTARNYADSVDIKSPIHVLSWNIQKENDDLFLIINFMNVSEITVSAVMFLVFGFNSFADKVIIDGKNEFEALGQDYSINPGGEETLKILLPDSSIRKVDIKVEKVCFIDGVTMTCEESEWIDTKQEEIDSKYLECVKQENIQGKYYAIIKPNYWQCICGFVNTGKRCKICKMQKENATAYSKEHITETYDKYLVELEREKKRAEELRLEAERLAEAEQKRKKEEAELEKEHRKEIINKVKKICFGCVLIFVLATAFVGWIYPEIIDPYVKYKAAIGLFSEEEYDAATVAFEKLGNYKDSEDYLEKIDEINSNSVLAVFQKVNYDISPSALCTILQNENIEVKRARTMNGYIYRVCHFEEDYVLNDISSELSFEFKSEYNSTSFNDKGRLISMTWSCPDEIANYETYLELKEYISSILGTPTEESTSENNIGEIYGYFTYWGDMQLSYSTSIGNRVSFGRSVVWRDE